MRPHTTLPAHSTRKRFITAAIGKLTSSGQPTTRRTSQLLLLLLLLLQRRSSARACRRCRMCITVVSREKRGTTVGLNKFYAPEAYLPPPPVPNHPHASTTAALTHPPSECTFAPHCTVYAPGVPQSTACALVAPYCNHGIGHPLVLATNRTIQRHVQRCVAGGQVCPLAGEDDAHDNVTGRIVTRRDRPSLRLALELPASSNVVA